MSKTTNEFQAAVTNLRPGMFVAIKAHEGVGIDDYFKVLSGCIQESNEDKDFQFSLVDEEHYSYFGCSYAFNKEHVIAVWTEETPPTASYRKSKVGWKRATSGEVTITIRG